MGGVIHPLYFPKEDIMNKYILDRYVPSDEEIYNEQVVNIVRQLHPEYFDENGDVKDEENSVKVQELVKNFDKDAPINTYIDEIKEPVDFKEDDENITEGADIANPMIIQHYLSKTLKTTPIIIEPAKEEENSLDLDELSIEDDLNLSLDIEPIFQLDDFEEDENLVLSIDKNLELKLNELLDDLEVEYKNISESSSNIMTLKSEYKYYKDTKNIRLPNPINVRGSNYYPVYVVLTRSNTMFQKIVRPIAGLEYGHASITLDPKLERLFTFSSKTDRVGGGFSIESVKDGPMWELAQGGNEFAMYAVLLSKEKCQKVMKFINMTMKNVDKYSYAMKQLLRIPFNMVNPDKTAMICSEFVAAALQEADKSLVGGLHTSLTTPGNIINDRFFFVQKGYLKDYDYKKTLKIVREMAKTKIVIRYLVENYSGSANYEIFKSIYRNAPDGLNILLRKFYPTTIVKPAVLMRCTNGGVYQTSMILESKPDKDELMAIYNPDKNAYKVKIDDVEHVSYCYILHNLVKLIFLSDNGFYLEDPKTVDRINKFIINQWEGRVLKEWDILKSIKDKSDPRIKIQKQRLLDLMWDYRDNPHNFVRRNANRYLFAQFLGFIAFPVEEGFISKEEYKLNFKKIYDYDPSFFLTSDEDYPVFNATDLEMYANVLEEVDDFEKKDFVMNWLNKYIEFGCDFKISKDASIAKYIPKEFSTIIDDSFDFVSLNE